MRACVQAQEAAEDFAVHEMEAAEAGKLLSEMQAADR